MPVLISIVISESTEVAFLGVVKCGKLWRLLYQCYLFGVY